MKAYKNKKEKVNLTYMKEKLNLSTLGDLLSLINAVVAEAKSNKKLKIIFENKAWYKMQALIRNCDKEIGWDGTVTRENNIFTIHDILIFKQTVSGVTVDTDDVDFGEYLNNLDDETFNIRRFNGHSHVNMGVTPSATDTKYREESTQLVNDFYIYMIFNKRGDWSGEVYDIENNVIYGTEDIELITPENTYDNWAKEKIAENLKEFKPVITPQQRIDTQLGILENELDEENEFGWRNFYNREY